VDGGVIGVDEGDTERSNESGGGFDEFFVDFEDDLVDVVPEGLGGVGERIRFFSRGEIDTRCGDGCVYFVFSVDPVIQIY